METIITGHSMSRLRTFSSPWAHAQWFSADYMWLQDMRPHSLNQFFSLILFNKDWFLKHRLTALCGTPLNIQSWICTYTTYPFVGFHEDAYSHLCGKLPWRHLSPSDGFPKSPLCPTGSRGGRSRHKLKGTLSKTLKSSPPQIIFFSPTFVQKRFHRLLLGR